MDILKLLPLGMACLLSCLLTGVQIRLNSILRLTAAPRADRWHRTPTPSSGGIAIFAVTILTYCVFFWGQHGVIVLTAAGLWLIGLADDRMGLPPIVKLAAQSAAAVAVIASGVVFHATVWSGFNVCFTFLWLVGVTNAFNLIDNMDGLCAGVVVIISAFRFFLLAANGMWVDASLCGVIGAAYAGFLVWNYRPARIFMGDCGSMFAGFALAALTIASPLPHTKAFVAGICYAVLTFAYPLFDTALVSVLRKRAGRPISVGGRDHSSHRLVAAGLSESHTVWTLWVLTILGCGIGLLVHTMPLAGGLLWIGLAFFGRFLACYSVGDRRPITTPNCNTVPYGSGNPSANLMTVTPVRNVTVN